MPQPVTLEKAAEVVAAFVSNNPLPRGELPALIQAIHDTLARLSASVENLTPKEEPEGAGCLNPEVGHAGLSDLPGGRQTFQVAETAFGGARPDAGAVSREMEASIRLSCGCRQLRGESVGDGESDWPWTDGRKRRST
jgi:ROS/MUCR transcriptional regulator protein